MRSLASGMIVALLIPLLANFAPRTPASCCCRTMSSGTCPMRSRAAAGCDGHRSCAIDSSNQTGSSDVMLPSLLSQPVVLTARRTSFAVPAAASRTATLDAVTGTTLLAPPDPPPPRA